MSKLKKGFYYVEFNERVTIAELTDKGWMLTGFNQIMKDRDVEVLLPVMPYQKLLERYKFLNTKVSTLRNKKTTTKPSDFEAAGLNIELAGLTERFAELKHLTGLPVIEKVIAVI